MVDMVPDDDQRLILASVRAFLDDNAPLARLHGPPGGLRDRHLLPQMGELGWLALGVSGSSGGLGLGVAEEAILAAECGRALISPALIATVMAARLAAAEGLAELTAAILAGTVSVGFAVYRDEAPTDGHHPVLLVDTVAGSPFCLIGETGVALYPWAALHDVEPVASLDETVDLARATLDTGNALARGDEATATHAITLLAASLSGLAERACDEAVSYAGIRHQFGRPIGSFQAVKHRCADMAVRAAAARAQTMLAAVAADDGLDGPGLEAAAAHLVAASAATANAAAIVQVFGGMGYTAECDAHLFVKRAQILIRLAGAEHASSHRLIHAA